MASIGKRGDRCQARVNRKGFPQQTKTSPTMTEAVRWSQVIESEMSKGLCIGRTEAERITFGDPPPQ